MSDQIVLKRVGRGPTARVEIPKDVLTRLYEVEKHSTLEIARLIGCSKKTVRLRLKEHGIPRRTLREAFAVSPTHQRNAHRRGPECGAWKGGTCMKTGYRMVMMPEHPEANGGGYVFEHRIIAETKIKRPLGMDEDVHHLNSIKLDNRLENIVVMTHSDHMALHMKDKHAAGKIPHGGKR